MLIQLVFWYFAVVLRMPGIEDAARWYGGAIFSKQGVFLPGLSLTPTAAPAAVWVLIACVVLVVAACATKRYRRALLGGSLVMLVASVAIGFPWRPPRRSKASSSKAGFRRHQSSLPCSSG